MDKKYLLNSVVFIVLVLIISSCAPNYTQDIPASETVFELTLPEAIPEESAIYLEIVDEVTGILLNPSRYEMERKSDSEFFVRLPITNGSLVKYRYLKRETSDKIELDAHGKTVIYRIYHVSRPSIIADRIIGWEKDDLFVNKSGEISGYVFDNKSNTPLEGVLVSINSQITSTSPDGFYKLRDIPAGEYTITAFHPNGSYKNFQQSAVIAENAVTPASFGMDAAKYVMVDISVSVPEETIQGAPLMLIGNTEDLGNTFAVFESGTSVTASLAKKMVFEGNGKYTLSLELPEGTDLRYKYSLGDGFINAEYDENGKIFTRQLIVPGKNIRINDSVNRWSDTEDTRKLAFSITVPENTTPSESVYIQFHPYTWMPPIPMWPVGENKYSYVVYGPFNYLDKTQFRICRNGQCGLADDITTMGENASGYLLEIPNADRTKKLSYEVPNWAFSTDTVTVPNTPSTSIQRENFIKAVSFSEAFSPTWMPHIDWGFIDSALFGANSVVISPEWKISTGNTPQSSLDPATSPSYFNLQQLYSYAQESNLSPILYPQVDYGENTAFSYWEKAPLTYNWWHAWFDEYAKMINNYAYLAESKGAPRLVIGGPTASPALPKGRLPNGSPANTPFDFANRWEKLIAEVRERYSGVLIFALPDESTINLDYEFLSQTDMIMIEMKSPVVAPNASSAADISAGVQNFFDESAYPFVSTYLKPIIIAVDFSSLEGSGSDCRSKANSCEFIIKNGYSTEQVDLDEQMYIYDAILSAVLQREWILGVVSMGYNPSVAILDGSSSVRGKPAGEVLRHYFSNVIQD